MRYLKSILWALGLSIALLAGVGFFLKSDYKIERSILIKSSADTLFPYLNNLENWQKWTTWSKKNDASLIIERNKVLEGKGAEIRWKGDYTEPVKVEITEIDPGKMVRFIVEENQMVSKGLLTLESQGKATKIIWRMEGSVGGNIAGRYFLLFMEKFMESDMEKGLNGLKKIGERE